MSDPFLDIAAFYDHLAPDYNRMTGFEDRFVRELPFFKSIVEKHGLRTALDAGCGTGFHSVLLARLGVRVTGADLSEVMLEKLRDRALKEGLPIATVRASFQELHPYLKTSFDGVFCMGNALAHLLTDHDLRLALKNFSLLLRSEGILVVQVLNFERILLQRPRMLSVKTEGAVTFTRFYEYDDPLIRFNIAKSTEGREQYEEVTTTTLRPVLWRDISSMLGDEGFVNVQCFGSLSMEEYAPASSQDLLIRATKKSAVA